jgi:hypothetical protein
MKFNIMHEVSGYIYNYWMIARKNWTAGDMS